MSDAQSLGRRPHSALSGGDASLVIRIVTVILFVFVGSIGLVGVLSFLKFERAYIDQVSQRYDSVLIDTKGILERSFGAGLTLRANRAIPVAIERAKQELTDVSAIVVLDPAGRVAHMTAGSDPERVPELQDIGVVSFTGITHVVFEDSFVAAAYIRSDNRVVGYLAIQFGSAQSAARVDALATRMFNAGVLVVVCLAPVVLAFTMMVVVPQESRQRTLARGVWIAATGQPDRDRDAPHALLEGVRKVEDALSKAESDEGGRPT